MQEIKNKNGEVVGVVNDDGSLTVNNGDELSYALFSKIVEQNQIIDSAIKENNHLRDISKKSIELSNLIKESL